MRTLLLISACISIAIAEPAKAWWGKYGSKYEADIARREWESNGGKYTVEKFTKNRRRVLKEALRRPWTYPPGNSDPSWTPYLKNCWDSLVRDGAPMVCIGNLNSAGKPWVGLFGENRYRWEDYEVKSESKFNIRDCWHEEETMQYVCEQKKGVKMDAKYIHGEVPDKGYSFKYFKY